VKDTKQLLLTVGPKDRIVASDFAALTHGLRTHGIKLEESATDILERVDRQSNRVDTMLTNMLDTVDRAVAVVAESSASRFASSPGVAAFCARGDQHLAWRCSVPAVRAPAHTFARRQRFVRLTLWASPALSVGNDEHTTAPGSLAYLRR